jgi:hypothetical protein
MSELTLDDGQDGTLLDSRGTLETVGVDTWKPKTVRKCPHFFFPDTGEYHHIPRSNSGFNSIASKESVISS